VRTIAIINQKGGCGKTTTAISLAGVFSQRDQHTLLVDLDPQSHCAAGLAIPEEQIDLHIGDALLADPDRPVDLRSLAWRVRKRLSVIPSGVQLAGLESARGGLAEAEDRDRRLSDFLDRHCRHFAWRILDCPPSIGLLTYNALRAADLVLIPVETGFFSMHGARRQVAAIRSLGRRLGGQTPYRVLATMHDPSSELAADVLAELRRVFTDSLLETVIRLDPRIREATSLGQPVNEYEPGADGSADYTAAAREIASIVFSCGGRPEQPSTPDHAPEASVASAPASPRSSSAFPQPPGSHEQSSSAPDDDEAPVPLNRAAELAERARRLLARTNQLQQRLDERHAPSDQAPDENTAPAPPDAVRRPSTPLRLIEDKPRQTPTPSRLDRLYGARETSQGVLFIHPGAPGSSICIAGAFNNWTPARTPLRYNDQMGVHEAVVPLPPGSHEYRIVVDGRWIADPFNDDAVTNPYGERNSVIVVTRDPARADHAGQRSR